MDDDLQPPEGYDSITDVELTAGQIRQLWLDGHIDVDHGAELIRIREKGVTVDG